MSRTLGKAIVEARQARGMTQFELADKMDVTDKAVSAWERGIACPDIDSFSHLAEVLHVSTDELLALPRTQKGFRTKKTVVWKIVDLVLIGLGLAMGVAVAILNILGETDAKTTGILLGIGLFCVSLFLLDQHTND